MLHYGYEEDRYVGMGLRIRYSDEDTAEYATVKRRRVGEDEQPVGTTHNNLILDTRQEEVQYYGGETEYLNANVITDNILSRVEEEGHLQMMLDEITDHRKDDYPISK